VPGAGKRERAEKKRRESVKIRAVYTGGGKILKKMKGRKAKFQRKPFSGRRKPEISYIFVLF
jgi:hypothetical protein